MDQSKVIQIVGRPVIRRERGRTHVSIIHPGLSFSRFLILHTAENFESSLEKSLAIGGRMMTDAEARYILRIIPYLFRRAFAVAGTPMDFWVFARAMERLPSTQKMAFSVDVERGVVTSFLRQCEFPVVVVME
jgi:hypothetical protein